MRKYLVITNILHTFRALNDKSRYNMENVTLPPDNPDNEAVPTPEKSKRKRVSFDEWIARFRLAFTNGQLPEILAVMSTVGYTAERLQGYLTKTDDLAGLNQTQKKEYGEQYDEKSKYETLRAEIDNTFRTHRALLRLLFKSNVKYQTMLSLGDRLKTAFGKWTQTIENFYSQIKASPELIGEVQAVSLTPEVADEMLGKLVALRSLKKSHTKESAEAQAATEARDTAFDELYPHYREFIDYAKILLTDNQLLEALGIVVKR